MARELNFSSLELVSSLRLVQSVLASGLVRVGRAFQVLFKGEPLEDLPLSKGIRWYSAVSRNGTSILAS